MIKRLVISYSDDDRDIALKVRNQLTEAGYDVWIAHLDIRGSVDWTQSILDAIDSRDGLVLVWSESAIKSENVREEIRLARVFLKPIFPFLAHPMTRVPSLPNEIQTLQVIQIGDFDSNVAELKARLSDPKRSTIQYADIAEHGFIPKARNPYFIGRNRELKDLFIDSRGYRGVTRKGLPISISGLAGIGKTQLALAFGYRFNLFFPEGVYWVDVPNGIVHEFGKIGPYMGVEQLQDERPYDYAIRVLERLGQLREGLIIFDNITNLDEFSKWCPEGMTSCSVILTTRMSPRAFRARVMNLTELDPDSAYEMLIARRKDGEEISRDETQRGALREICRVTGNHPLALELCASRLQSEFIRPSDYLTEIQPDPLRLLGNENRLDVSLSAGTASLMEVLRHSYASLDKKLVERYFLLMCCFAPHGINKELIVPAYGELAEGGKALDQLSNFSFVRRELSNFLSLHPLVAQFGRDLQKHQNIDYPGKFVEVMLGFLRAHGDNLASDAVRREKPHIDEALRVAQELKSWDACANLFEYEADIEAGLPEQIKSLENAYRIIEQYLPQQKRKLPGLRLRLGKAHRAAGQVREALDDFSQTEILYREIKDIDPAEVASLRFELGDTYLALGFYAEAGKTLSDALKIAEKDLDESAPEVLQLRQALARRLLYLGEYDKAGDGLAGILNYRKKFYTTQPDATSAAGLASTHADLSRLALARAHYDDAIQAANAALKITREYHSESDADCSHLYLLIGTIHYESGDYSLAEEQLDKARQNFLTTFGEQHPNYGRALMVLGEVHRKQGKFDKAGKEVDCAIAIFENVYGKGHPSIAEALDVKGKIYDHLGEFGEEEKVWKRVLEIQNEFYSKRLPDKSYLEKHPALATTHYNYASLFLRKGEYAQAAKHLQSSLRITEENFGKNHIEYFGRLVRLATCRYEQQKYLEAQKVLDEAKGLQNTIFGNSPHPYIARMQQLQSEVLRQQGRFVEALEVIDQTIAMKKAIYGTEEHPSVAEALDVKGKIYDHLGEFGEEEKVWERVLEIQNKFYSERLPDKSYLEKHPALATTHYNYASLFLRKGEYAQAAKHLQSSLRITEENFGKNHIEYFGRLVRLATCRYEQQEYSLAQKVLDEAKGLQNTIFGNSPHPYIARMQQLQSEVLRQQGRFVEALEVIDQTIAMKKAIYGTEEHPSVAEALDVKGKIYDHLGEFGEEEKVWKRVLEIQNEFYSKQLPDKSYLEKHPALATTHYNYASLFLRKGEYAQAAKHLQSSLRITEENFGKNHIEYFGRLVRLATCRYEQQKYLEAQKVLDEAKGLQNTIFGNSPHPYIARMQQLQSEVLRQQGRFVEALEVIDQTIAMKKAIYGTEEHPSVAEALDVKGKIYDHLGEFGEEEKVWKRVLEIQNEFYSKQLPDKSYLEKHPALATTHYNYASLFLRKGEYAQAAKHLQSSLRITEENFGKNHIEYFGRLVRLATCRYEQQEYSLAQKVLDEAKGLQNTIFGNSPHPYIARMQQLQSEVLRQQGRFVEALEVIDQTIAMKKAIYGTEEHPSVAEALDVKGKIYDHLGEFGEEEKVWKRVLEIQNEFYSKQLPDKSYLEKHPALATTHYNYASLFLRKGEYAQAAKHLQSSLRITEENFGKNHIEYFGRLVRLATCRYEQQEYSLAQKVLDEAKGLQNTIFGNSPHPYIARMQQLQSEVLRQQGRFVEALEVIDQTIAMKKAIYGTEEHPSVAEALEVKVDLLLSQLRLRESEEILDTIEQIRNNAYGKNHPEYADYQMRRAEWYLMVGRYDEARKILEQSLQTCLNSYSVEHPETIRRQIMLARMDRMANRIVNAETRINSVCETLGARLETEKSLIVAETFRELSNIRRVMGNYRAALEELGKALKIETEIFGPESPKVIDLQNEKAKSLILFRSLTEADHVIESALRYTEFDQPIFKRLRSNLLEQRGILQDYKMEYNRAIESVDEAIRLKKELLGDENVELARLYIEKAVVLRHQGKYNEALANLDKALNIDNVLHFDANHVYFARILLEQGQTYLDKKSVLAAQEHLKEALKIYDIQPNRNVKQHADAAQALGRNYLENGLLRDASVNFQEALDIRTVLYGSLHPEIAETLHYQAQTLLNMSEADGNENSRIIARQKLEQALNMLRKGDSENAKLISDIELTLANL